jgi:hypothetical protein
MITTPTTVDPTINQFSVPPMAQTSRPNASGDNIQFPKSAFVGLGGDFVNIYRERLESPPEFLFAAWHACFGATISPFIRLNSILDLPPRIYVVNIGSSAVPRKSTSIKVAVKSWQQPSFFAAAPNENKYLRVENGLGSAEGFVRVFNGWSKKDKKEGGDTRPTLVVYDELRSFVMKAQQKGSTLLPFLTSMFEGEDYDNTTVGRPISVRSCHIGLIGACTLDTFADMWTSEFTSIGFPNRLFLVKGNPQRRISFPEYPSAGQLDELSRRMFDLVETIKRRHVAGNGRISLSKLAQHRWDDYYMSSMTSSIHSKRLDTYAFKWMMLLSLSQEEFEISQATVDLAIDLSDYQLQIRKLYDPIDAENKFAHMEEKIRRYLRAHSDQWVSRRELSQATNSHRTGVYLFAAAIENLVKSQEIQPNGSRKEWKWVHVEERHPCGM